MPNGIEIENLRYGGGYGVKVSSLSDVKTATEAIAKDKTFSVEELLGRENALLSDAHATLDSLNYAMKRTQEEAEAIGNRIVATQDLIDRINSGRPELPIQAEVRRG